MNKKLFALMMVVLSSTCICTVAFAQQQERKENFFSLTNPRYPKVFIMYGVGLDKESMETEPVVFLRIKYGSGSEDYLIVDGNIYGMEETFQRYDWETGTKIYQYESDDGNVMTVLIQHFDYGIGISAEFKNYLIVFETRGYSTPVKIVKPVPHIARELEKKGIDIEEILESANEPINEWVK